MNILARPLVSPLGHLYVHGRHVLLFNFSVDNFHCQVSLCPSTRTPYSNPSVQPKSQEHKTYIYIYMLADSRLNLGWDTIRNKRVMETTSAGTAMQQQQQTILINKNETKKMKVMVAIDESDVSFYALKWAVDHLFVSIGVAPETSLEEVGMLVVVHVQQPFHHFAFPAGPGGASS